MSKQKKLEKMQKLKEFLFSEFAKCQNDGTQINTKKLLKKATLYIHYDKNELILKEAHRQIHYFLRHVKGDDQLRRYFSDGKCNVIDVENTKDVEALQKILNHLYKDISGYTKSYKKIYEKTQKLKPKRNFLEIVLKNTASSTANDDSPGIAARAVRQI